MHFGLNAKAQMFQSNAVKAFTDTFKVLSKISNLIFIA